MGLRSRHTTDDDCWPKGVDESISARLTQPGFRVLLTLAGAAAGLYVVLSGGQGVAYLGPFVGACGVYQLWAAIVRAALAHGATHAEWVRKE